MMTVGDAIAIRDSYALVSALETLAVELGVDALIDVLTQLPATDAEFARKHVIVNRDPYSKLGGELTFEPPAPDLAWNETRGAWDLLS